VQIYVVGGLASLLIAGIVGYIADKFGVEKIFPPYAALVIIPSWIVSTMTTHSLLEITIVAAIFMAGIAGRIVGSMTLLNAVIREDLRAGFFSLNICFQQLAMGVASLITGWLLVKRPDGGFDHFDRAGFLAIVFGLGAVLVSVLLIRQLPARSRSSTVVASAEENA
jgi:MFS family permease